MTIRTKEQREALIEGGKRLGIILQKLSTMVAPGVSAEDLDNTAEQLIRDGGDTPAFLGYTPEGAARPYPASLCVSINDEVVHGIPNESTKVLKEGDIVALDLGLVHDGIIVDAAVSVPVAGIAAATVGGRVGDISAAIEDVIDKSGFSVVKVLGGHGVGIHVHEEPFVPNYGHPGTGEELEEGMVLALEPIATAGKGSVTIVADGYTYRTKDGSRSSHHEHTILIEKSGTTVVTRA
jgi:methionyl aminopeptidase